MDSQKQSPMGSVSNRYFCNTVLYFLYSFSTALKHITANLEAENHTHLLSRSFWAWLNLVLCSGSHQAELKLLARAAVSSESWGSSSELSDCLAEFYSL